MLLERFFPDDRKNSAYSIDYEQLYAEGFRGLIFDIDNTLVEHGADATDRAVRLMERLKADGFQICLLSNNRQERVERFNRTLGLPAYWKSGKPFAKTLIRAMEEMGSDRTNTVVLGDQLLTDALAGKHIGLRVLIVPPIRDKRTLFFRFKRWCEKPFIRRFKKKHGIEW